jgi:hypothetical protein
MPQESLPRLGDNADGVRAAGVLMTAATGARWPMYLRNVKQILRAGSFDERRYGFGGLLDLLKACQRDGLVRIERDRRGGLRVFQGPNMSRSTPVAAPDAAQLSSDVDVVEVMIEPDGSDTEPIDVTPVSVVDTTAELLGRAKARKPRARAATSRIGQSDTPERPAKRKPARAKRRPQRRGGRRRRQETNNASIVRCVGAWVLGCVSAVRGARVLGAWRAATPHRAFRTEALGTALRTNALRTPAPIYFFSRNSIHCLTRACCGPLVFA